MIIRRSLTSFEHLLLWLVLFITPINTLYYRGFIGKDIVISTLIGNFYVDNFGESAWHWLVFFGFALMIPAVATIGILIAFQGPKWKKFGAFLFIIATIITWTRISSVFMLLS